MRPPEYLEDRHERELEIKAAEKRLALLENRTCRNCGGEVEPTFLRCPSCMRKLKEPCRSCGKPLDPRWRVCPYCEAEVAGFRAGAARARRGARAVSRNARTAGAQRAVGGGRESNAIPGERARPRPRTWARTAPRRTAVSARAEAPAREPTSQPPPSSPKR